MSERNREWSLTRMQLISARVRNRRPFRVVGSDEVVVVHELAPSDSTPERTVDGHWKGIRVLGRNGSRWVDKTELAPLGRGTPLVCQLEESPAVEGMLARDVCDSRSTLPVVFGDGTELAVAVEHVQLRHTLE